MPTPQFNQIHGPKLDKIAKIKILRATLVGAGFPIPDLRGSKLVIEKMPDERDLFAAAVGELLRSFFMEMAQRDLQGGAN